jgi:MoaA/NifB/PqqE/SkfB family radical SAM enzyme
MRLLDFEVTNRCNARCVHCPRESILRPIGTMDAQTFGAIIKNLHGLAPKLFDAVSFCGMGEPLLNKRIDKFVTTFSLIGLPTYLTTNASRLHSWVVDNLKAAGLDRIIVSFNGSTPAFFSKMSGDLSLERVTTRIMYALQSGIRVSANIIANTQVRPHVHEIRRYLNNIGITEIAVTPVNNRGGKVPADICDRPVTVADRCNIYDGILFVAWNGDVLTCCHDLTGERPIGNLILEDIETILERKGEWTPFDLCATCNDIHR